MALTDNLVAYWKLDESSGNRADSTGLGSTQQEASGSVSSATGKISSGASFVKANNRWLRCPSNSNVSMGNISFTVTCWVKLTTKAADTIFVSKCGATNGTWQVTYKVANDRFVFQTWGLASYAGYAEVVAAAAGSPSTGTWYFVVCTHNASTDTISIQVNNDGGNNSAAANSNGTYVESTNDLSFSTGDPAQQLDGVLDEVGIWKRTLTSVERSNLYNNGSGLVYPLLFNSLTYLENFTTLDTTALWFISDGYTNGGIFNCWWSSASVSVVGGALSVSLFPNAALTPPNSAGEVRTRNHYGYGLYEARLKTGSVAGVNYGFYTYTGPYEGNPWDEIDFEFATFGPSYDHIKLQCNYYVGGTGGHEILVELGFDPSAAYHTYAFRWLPTGIKWYVDGTQVAQTSSGATLPTNQQRIYFNIWPPTSDMTGWTGGPYSGTTTSMQVDWVQYTPDYASRNKRATSIGIDGIYRMVLPVPDSAVSVEDRYQISGKPRMVAAPPAALIFRNRTASRMRFPTLPC